MSFPVSELPMEILLKIQEKMTVRTFCRLRQTCKGMDELAEKNRFRIQVSCDETWLLFIAMGEETKPGFNFEVLPKGVTSLDNIDNYKGFANQHSITDPYKQLSAMKFDTINMCYFESTAFFDTYAFNHQFLPLLHRLRLECRELCVFTEKEHPNLEKRMVFQPPVKCEEFYNVVPIYPDFKVMPGLKELFLYGEFVEIPRDIGPVVRNAETVCLVKGRVNEGQRWLARFEDFLNQVSKSQSARGKLKLLRFEVCDEEENVLKNPISLQELWKGEIYQYGEVVKVTAQKLPIDGGTAIILYFDNNKWFLTHFCDQFDRQKLLDLISVEFLMESPIDLSSLYDDFMEASDDKSALEILLSNYATYPRVEYDDDEEEEEDQEEHDYHLELKAVHYVIITIVVVLVPLYFWYK